MSSTAHVIIKVFIISSHSKKFCFMKYEQIWKKFFLPEKHTYIKELIINEEVYLLVLFFILPIVIIINIGLIKYLVWFMTSDLSIRVDKQTDIDHLASQSPLFRVKTNSNFRIRLPFECLLSKQLGFCVRISEFEFHHYHMYVCARFLFALLMQIFEDAFQLSWKYFA